MNLICTLYIQLLWVIEEPDPLNGISNPCNYNLGQMVIGWSENDVSVPITINWYNNRASLGPIMLVCLLVWMWWIPSRKSPNNIPIRTEFSFMYSVCYSLVVWISIYTQINFLLQIEALVHILIVYAESAHVNQKENQSVALSYFKP